MDLFVPKGERPILLGAPCFREEFQPFRDAVVSFADPAAHVLMVDNGGSESVKATLRGLDPSTYTVIHNPRNIFINPAWNQIARIFLRSSARVLVVANSDVLLSFGWGDALWDRARSAEQHGQKEIWFGVTASREEVQDVRKATGEVEGEGRHTRGHFFALPRWLVGEVFPIPGELLFNYGDDWIWMLVRAAGCESVCLRDVRVWHALSTSSRTLGAEWAERTARDERAWNEGVRAACEARAAQIREARL